MAKMSRSKDDNFTEWKAVQAKIRSPYPDTDGFVQNYLFEFVLLDGSPSLHNQLSMALNDDGGFITVRMEDENGWEIKPTLISKQDIMSIWIP
jgi:hypothetical protein